MPQGSRFVTAGGLQLGLPLFLTRDDKGEDGANHEESLNLLLWREIPILITLETIFPPL